MKSITAEQTAKATAMTTALKQEGRLIIIVTLMDPTTTVTLITLPITMMVKETLLTLLLMETLIRSNIGLKGRRGGYVTT